MGVTLSEAPTFTFLDRKKAGSTLDVSGQSKLLTLDVPASQVLLTDYNFWAWTVLWSWCGFHGPGIACETACREESWRAALFSIPEDPSKQQGILNRLEPGWLKSIYPASLQEP
jgi:hypothetical protein